MSALFKKNYDFHPNSTKIADLYHIPSVKLDFEWKRDKYRGAIVTNGKVHGANKGALPAPDGHHVGPMNLVIRGIALEEINSEVFEAIFKKALTRMITQIAKFMGPIWGPPGSCRPQMGPMFAPWTLLSGVVCFKLRCLLQSNHISRALWHVRHFCYLGYDQWYV